MKKELNFSMFFLSSFLIIGGVSFSSIDLMTWGLFIAFFNNIFFAVTEVKKHAIFFFYHITLFIFLLGRIFVSYFLKYNPLDTMLGLDFYDEKIVIKVVLLLFLSLQSLFLSYYLTENTTITFNKKLILISDKLNKQVQSIVPQVKKISFVILCVTFLFRLAQVIDIFLFVQNNGYNAYYISFETSLPFIVTVLASFFSISFFTYIATLPKKKELYLPLILYFIEGIFSLATGQRNMFALNVLILAIYLIFRMKKEINLFKLNKKVYIVIAIGLVSTAFIFIIIGNLRWGLDSSNQGFISKIARLLFDQGVSVNLIGYSMTLHDFIPTNKFYSFSPFIRLAKDVLSIFFDIPTFNGQTLENALYGDAFTYTITYLIMPLDYLRGRGYGSTYIAELFVDFSYAGVILGNFFYGWLMSFLNKVNKLNFIVSAFSLLMIRYFLFTPRAGFLDFITYVFSVYHVAFMFILVSACFMYRWYLRKKSIN